MYVNVYLNVHVYRVHAWCARMCVLHTYMHMAYMHIEYTCTMMYTHIYTTVCVCVYIYMILCGRGCVLCVSGVKKRALHGVRSNYPVKSRSNYVHRECLCMLYVCVCVLCGGGGGEVQMESRIA